MKKGTKCDLCNHKTIEFLDLGQQPLANKYPKKEEFKNEEFFPNKWELPSGKVEFGEDADSALIREVLEETGLKAIKFVPFKCTHYIIEKPEKKRHTIQIIYLTSVKNSAEIILSEEHDKYEWITLEEVDQLDTFEDMPIILKEAQERIGCLNYH